MDKGTFPVKKSWTLVVKYRFCEQSKDIISFIDNEFDVSVGTGEENEYCVPFVSEYTDCTEENLCEGCVKCTCNSRSTWVCEDKKQCKPGEEDESTIEDEDISGAFEAMMNELKEREKIKRLQSETPLVPRPGAINLNKDHNSREAKELLLASASGFSVEDEILELMRQKRSANIGVPNNTVKFYHTKDEVNEDTLKNLNISGTLKAKKFDGKLQSRRSGLSSNSTNSLQIEYSQPKIYNHHITDNKIDTITPEVRRDPFVQQKIASFVGNHTQEQKNNDLSKLLVSELAIGHEAIGDHNAPIISNITFLEQNETLTAMALIAGNLLNKLWHMEKDATGDAIDIEMLRHEKISDLLELFKEPLNLKQQQFLKNALEQLSSALDKHKKIEDVSLCANVEELKKAEAEKSKANCNNNKKESNKAEPEVKLGGIIDLVKKYEHLQSKLNILRSGVPKDTVDKIVTKDEQIFLNNYGQILETITKLLVPKSASKKIVNGIQNTNPLVNDESLRQKLKTLYDIDLGIMNITVKDKIVLDYLTHIQGRPECLLKKQKPFVTPTIEGNILLNLSEFFKIKSLSELFNKMKEGDKKSSHSRSLDDIVQNHVEIPTLVPSTTTSSTTTTTRISKPKTIIYDDIKKRSKVQNKNKFEATKDKLKEHLKAILQDIVELQKSAGQTADGKNVKIADALPCIYQLLNTKSTENINEDSNSKSHLNAAVENSTKKMHDIFESLKNDLKFTQTRRTGSYSGPRPKSAIVWERVVRNQGEKQMKTRRSFDTLPKSLEQIKNLIHEAESAESNTYKNYALMYEVPAGDRYVLLKTFESDVNTYMDILESIKTTIDSMDTLPSSDYTDIKNFIENAAMNMNLNERIVKNLDKPKSKAPSIKELIAKNSLNKQNKGKSPVRFTKVSNVDHNSNKKLNTANFRNYGSYENMDPSKVVKKLTTSKYNHNNNVKLTREQLISQLIRNRIQHYIKVRETEMNAEGDLKYDVAKKIIQNLDLGNFELAKELYKIFALHKSKGLGDDEDDEPSTSYVEKPSFYKANFNKQPLIQFANNKEKDALSNKDQIIKQLLSLRNLKI